MKIAVQYDPEVGMYHSEADRFTRRYMAKKFPDSVRILDLDGETVGRWDAARDAWRAAQEEMRREFDRATGHVDEVRK